MEQRDPISSPTNGAPDGSRRPPLALRFGTQELPRDNQFAAWREICGPLADVSLPQGTSERGGYSAELTAYNLGGLIISSESFDAFDYELGPAATGRHVDHWMLSLCRHGHFVTASDDQVVESSPGTLSLRSLTRPFVGRSAAGQMTFVFISRDSCPEFAAIFDGASNRKISGALSALLADFLLILESRLPSLEAHQLPVLGRSALSMIATCIAPTGDTLAYARPEIATTLLERAKRYIRSNISSHTLSAEELCLALGVSRTQLYRLFEGHGGVAREIRLQRLIASHAVLVDPNDRRPVYRISEDFGFTSADEFGRAFRRQFGYTPGDARHLRHRREAVAYGLPPEGDDFRGWMRDLGRRPSGK